MIRVLNAKNLLHFAFLIFDFSLVVDFNRAYVIELNRETHRLRQTYWYLWQFIVVLFDSKQSLVGS